MTVDHAEPRRPATGVRSSADRSFHLAIAFVVALVVAMGFGRTVDAGLVHPPSPRPLLLCVHAAMFTAWVLLYVMQAALVRFDQMSWHRRLGIGGLMLGALMPIVGVSTVLVMARLHRIERGATQPASHS